MLNLLLTTPTSVRSGSRQTHPRWDGRADDAGAMMQTPHRQGPSEAVLFVRPTFSQPEVQADYHLSQREV